MRCSAEHVLDEAVRESRRIVQQLSYPSSEPRARTWPRQRSPCPSGGWRRARPPDKIPGTQHADDASFPACERTDNLIAPSGLHHRIARIPLRKDHRKRLVDVTFLAIPAVSRMLAHRTVAPLLFLRVRAWPDHRYLSSQVKWYL